MESSELRETVAAVVGDVVRNRAPSAPHTQRFSQCLFSCSGSLAPLLTGLASKSVRYEDVLDTYEALLRLSARSTSASELATGGSDSHSLQATTGAAVFTRGELQEGMHRLVQVLADDASAELYVRTNTCLDAGLVLRRPSLDALELEVPEQAAEIEEELSEVLFQEFVQGKLAAFHLVRIASALSQGDLYAHRPSPTFRYLYSQSCVQTLEYTTQRLRADLQQLLGSPVFDEALAAEFRFALCTNPALVRALCQQFATGANDDDAAAVLEFAFCPAVVTEAEGPLCAEIIKLLDSNADSETAAAEILRLLQHMAATGAEQQEHEQQQQQQQQQQPDEDACFLASQILLARALAEQRVAAAATLIAFLQRLKTTVSQACSGHCIATVMHAVREEGAGGGSVQRFLVDELQP